jgi:hypothetical protein
MGEADAVTARLATSAGTEQEWRGRETITQAIASAHVVFGHPWVMACAGRPRVDVPGT